ncbi:Hypp4882 [Branchiostoma lanceolatum]|uniref:Hypp4882 protein n=1 Tax=Branchiostoma lanceolatum TaxID=7740 RepID=A0A8K0AD55_BRALA|nr:Hypp4882 [Branchiostoma lanceolatum]
MTYGLQDMTCYEKTEMTCRGMKVSPRLVKPTLLEKYKKVQGGGFVEVRSVLEPTSFGRPCRKGYISVHLPRIQPDVPALMLQHQSR